MNKIIYITCALILYCNFANAQWVYVGSPGVSSSGSGNPSIAFDSSGVPYIAYADVSSDWKANVKKYINGNWVQVGDSNFSTGGQALPTCLAFDTNDTTYVAYNNSLGYIIMEKYDGANWLQVGDAFFADTIGLLNFFIDRKNTPHMACVNPNNFIITVYSYDSTGWTVVGNRNVAEFDYDASFAIDQNSGTPYVLFVDDSLYTGDSATVMTYSNNEWISVGSPRFYPMGNYNATITIDNNGTPIIAFQSVDTSGGKATALKYNGTDWVTIGEPDFSPGLADLVSVQTDVNNVPYVEYIDDYTQAINVMKFNGTQWEQVGKANFSDSASGATFAIDKNSVPYVAYSDQKNSSRLSVMKYDSITGINDAGVKAGFKLSPNPAQNNVTIQWQPNQSNEDTHLLIYDLLGNEVSDFKINNKGQVQVNISGLADGLYIVRLLSYSGESMGEGKLAVVK